MTDVTFRLTHLTHNQDVKTHRFRITAFKDRKQTDVIHELEFESSKDVYKAEIEKNVELMKKFLTEIGYIRS